MIKEELNTYVCYDGEVDMERRLCIKEREEYVYFPES